MAAISAAINDGRISAEEADHLVNFFSSFAKILEARDFMARLDAVESRLSEIGK